MPAAKKKKSGDTGAHDPSQPLNNSRREKFCQLLATDPTLSNAQAYEQAGYNSTGAAASSAAHTLFKIVEIRERVKFLRQEIAQANLKSREEILARLMEIGFANEKDRVSALQLATKILGWEKAPTPSDEPTRHSIAISVDPSTLKSIARRDK